ncbi:MAG TPA: type II toxin-antitoxin system HicA family toxin [Fimbriimonas sp.]|nr:type II toxin-antitoxin system HicA family toxin [Fimbriimonas sp.]
MGRAPRVTAKDVIRVLERLGFELSRSKGSHRVYRHPDGRRTVVPFHGGETLHPKTFASILKDANITSDEFEDCT